MRTYQDTERRTCKAQKDKAEDEDEYEDEDAEKTMHW